MKNSDFFRLAGKLILLSVPLLLLMGFAFRYPMSYMGVEYTMWQEEKDFISSPSSGEDPSILILGDSRAKSSILPGILVPSEHPSGQGAVNIAIGGATPIEMYYALRTYLSCHRAPEHAFILFAPYHFCEIDNWQQTLYYNYLPLPEVLETELEAIRLKERGSIRYPGAAGDLLSFRLRLPNKYLDAVYQARFIGNREANLEKYRSVREEGGYTEFGTDDGNDGLNYETHHEDFDSLPLVTSFYERLLSLCEEAGIHAVLEQAPINEASAQAMHPEFMEGYRAFMKSCHSSHPDFTVVTEVPVYENRYFGDNNHMNRKGAERFSAFLKTQYRDILEQAATP